ncbi:Arrestin domain-containing protein A [Phytophthora citrophthora]|uniref:Arrestin domain-containing protein A n=1 Tax=Phytophthora citrophthora TaxID=4793 RepID=A0AAD9G1H6_9STRA|nr:Arrestin domain-containing protein A [Phytophthora citrophthora]
MELMLDIRGLETIAWVKRQGESTTHHQDKHVIIHKQLQISTDREIFFPGEYAYQFNYELQPTLPGSFQLSHRSAGRFRNIRSTVKYELKALQRVQGAFRADLEMKRELVVVPVPTAPVVRPLQRSTSQEVWVMTMFRKGTCQLSAYMDRDVFVPGEKVMVRCSIFNLSKVNIRALSLRLYEDLVLHHKRGKDTRTSTCLCEGEFSGVLAGDTADKIVSLHLMDWRSGRAIQPSTASRFIACDYRIEVRCSFMMSPSVSLEFPITVVHQNSK